MRMLKIFFVILLIPSCLSGVLAQPKKPILIRKTEIKQTPKAQTKQILPTEFEQNVIAELNKLRTNPSLYIKILEDYLSKFNGKNVKVSDKLELITEEGKTPVIEAIEFLKTVKSMNELKISNGLMLATFDHISDLVKNDIIGHLGSASDSPQTRAERYGMWTYDLRENISYGAKIPQDVIINFLIDDGVPSRNHRKVLLDRKLTKIGIASGVNKLWDPICVVMLAGDFYDKSAKGLFSFKKRNCQHYDLLNRTKENV
jgi:uncharacterized protein YkwD